MNKNADLNFFGLNLLILGIAWVEFSLGVVRLLQSHWRVGR